MVVEGVVAAAEQAATLYVSQGLRCGVEVRELTHEAFAACAPLSLSRSRAYVQTVSKNAIQAYLKKAKRYWTARVQEDPFEVLDRTVASPGPESGFELRSAVDALPEKLREAFLLAAQGRTLLEISRTAGVSLTTASKRVRAASQAIAALLEEECPDSISTWRTSAPE